MKNGRRRGNGIYSRSKFENWKDREVGGIQWVGLGGECGSWENLDMSIVGCDERARTQVRTQAYVRGTSIPGTQV